MPSLPSLPPPQLFTFDIFGTVLDWRTGLCEACAAGGRLVTAAEFDAVVDIQGRLESEPYRRYAEITADSLITGLGLPCEAAEPIAARVGEWPLFADSAAALAGLSRIAPCVAMTNSDHVHGKQVRRQTGAVWADWICAEDVSFYKPDPRFWDAVRRRALERFGVSPGPAWWHISAYADYDLDAARRHGLTTAFVARPHSRRPRSGFPALLTVGGLDELAIFATSLRASDS